MQYVAMHIAILRILQAEGDKHPPNLQLLLNRGVIVCANLCDMVA